MTIKINLNGITRKNLAALIAEQLESTAKYTGAPSFAYTAGPATIDKDGTVIFTEDTPVDTIRKVLDALDATGIEYDRPAELNNSAPAANHLTVSYPLEKLTQSGLRNLEMLLNAKRPLICKALGVQDIPTKVTELTVDFPWFHTNQTPESVHAYETFVRKLCEMAGQQQRVTAKEKPTDNEKYAFRCFLLRLGFIGDEYKTDRKILLRNLSGSGSFRSGAKKDGEQA